MSYDNTDWYRLQGPLRLNIGSVHVWRAHVPSSLHYLAILARTLSTEERARAQRFYREEDRNRFIVARGALRRLLGRYLELEAKDVAFVYGPYGKPDIDRVQNNERVSFSLSHSHTWVACAFAREHRIGIDIEYTTAVSRHDALVDQVLSESERRLFERLTEQDRATAFLDIWTRKEAYLKAIGTGLATAPTSIEIALDRDRAPPLMETAAGPDPAQWSIRDIRLAGAYSGAVAIDGQDFSYSFLTWCGEPD